VLGVTLRILHMQPVKQPTITFVTLCQKRLDTPFLLTSCFQNRKISCIRVDPPCN